MTTRFQQLVIGWVSASGIFLAAAAQSPADASAAWRQAAQSATIDPQTASRIERLTRNHIVINATVRPEAAPLELVVLGASAASARPIVDAAEQALSRYAGWLGPLPITRLTIIEVPGHLDLVGAAYPGIVITRLRWLTGRREFAIERDMSAAMARQYAVHLLNGAHRDAWFAEGLAGYLATRPMELRFDPRPALTPRYFGGFVPHSIRAISVSSAAPRPSVLDLAEFFEPGDAAWQLTRGQDRERAWRFSIALHSLERFIGWPAVQAMLRAFVQQRESGQPLLDDFVAVVNQQRGGDLSWFFDQALRPDAVVDYAIAVASKPASSGWQTTVDVRRAGEGTFRTLPVLVRFSDGSEVTEWIDGREREQQFQYSKSIAGLAKRPIGPT